MPTFAADILAVKAPSLFGGGLELLFYLVEPFSEDTVAERL